MFNYKKVFKSKKFRFRILAALRFIPCKTMLRLQYYVKTGNRLNLNNPMRYTEKIQWYKLNYYDPLMQRCVNKYFVKDYIINKGLENILNDLICVFDKPEDIDFQNLPDQFVLKLSNGSSTNLIVRDKSSIDIMDVKKLFKEFVNMSSSVIGGEWVYISKFPPVIIAERLLEDPTQKDNAISDYKFLCFHGKPKYIVYDMDRFADHKRNIYDTEWNNLHVSSDCPCCDVEIPKPNNLAEMLEVARILSEDFPAVRVDLYSIQGKIYFGELTFFPWSGYVCFEPDEFDFELGKHFILPEKNFN